MKGILALIVATCIPSSALGQLCVNQLNVPKYPPLAWSAQLRGDVDLTVTIGAEGGVVRVEGRGSVPYLVEHAKSNVKEWEFCSPKGDGSTHVQLRYEYRLEGARVYAPPTAKVVIDLAESRVVITSPPALPQP